MGLFGGLFGNSEARQKAKKYAKLVKVLEKKIVETEGAVNDAERGLKSIHTAFQKNPDTAEGKIKDTFDMQEENVWQPHYAEIINNMEAGLVGLRLKKISAEQLEIYWNMQAEIEEMKANG